jgi:hypothetical protein
MVREWTGLGVVLVVRRVEQTELLTGGGRGGRVERVREPRRSKGGSRMSREHGYRASDGYEKQKNTMSVGSSLRECWVRRIREETADSPSSTS